MKHTPQIALSVLVLAIGSTVASAQQPTEDDLNPQNRNPVGTQAGSELDSSRSSSDRGAAFGGSDEMSLEQVILLKPDELEGKALVNDDGEQIGEIEQIALKLDDQDAYALITTTQNDQAAVRVSELEIDALAYAEAPDPLSEQEYQSSEYERFSRTRTDPQGNAGSQAQAGRSAATQSTRGLADQVAQGAGIASQLDGSLLEHLAMAQPDELEGKKLMGEDGEELGEIDHIAKSRSGDELVAVVDTGDSSAMTVIPLTELQIVAVRFEGDADELEEESFDESEFQAISSAG